MYRNDFERDKARGKVGEEVVKKFFENAGAIVQDVSEIQEYQRQDIDCIVNDTTVQIKCDYRMCKTNNLFLEYTMGYRKDCRCYKKGDVVDGYLRKSKAKWLAYYDAVYDTLYLYEMGDIRHYCQTHRQKMEQRTCDDGYKVVAGYTVNKGSIPCRRYNNISLFGGK